MRPPETTPLREECTQPHPDVGRMGALTVAAPVMPAHQASGKPECELLPCPFCNAAMRIESTRDWHRLLGEHDEDCVFVDAETMMVPATDDQHALMLRDWNRRVSPTHRGGCREPRALAASVSTAGSTDTCTWQPLCRPGQVQLGDWICFTLAGKFICCRAREILNPGTAAEEIIYQRKKNHYFLTSMAVSGTSTHKDVLFARA